MADGVLELRVAWERHLGRTASTATTFESVVNRYREPHRRYHDVRHVRWVVRNVIDLAADRDVSDVGAIVAAAFFHDAIYDPTAAGNEAASAVLAGRELGALGWSADRIDAVREMIIGTIDHRWGDDTSIDADVCCAADLAVLAADPAAYSDYVRNVRREYHHVNDADWVTGRSAVLRSFLDREAIYSPRLSLTDWELRARGNITAELRSLDG